MRGSAGVAASSSRTPAASDERVKSRGPLGIKRGNKQEEIEEEDEERGGIEDARANGWQGLPPSCSCGAHRPPRTCGPAASTPSAGTRASAAVPVPLLPVLAAGDRAPASRFARWGGRRRPRECELKSRAGAAPRQAEARGAAREGI